MRNEMQVRAGDVPICKQPQSAGDVCQKMNFQRWICCKIPQEIDSWKVFGINAPCSMLDMRTSGLGCCSPPPLRRNNPLDRSPAHNVITKTGAGTNLVYRIGPHLAARLSPRTQWQCSASRKGHQEVCWQPSVQLVCPELQNTTSQHQ